LKPGQPPLITLVEISADNWEAVASLEVTESERAFVASNLYSLAQSRFEPAARPLALCADGTAVGFFMYEADDTEPDAIMIYRFMVDHKQRGRGYGRAGLALLLAGFEQDPRIRVVRVCLVPENNSARQLYDSLGFVEIGRDADGEIIAERAVASPRLWDPEAPRSGRPD